MILFCDTSALAKLFIQEEHSKLMMETADQAATVAVCRIAWAEMMAAMARRAREVPADSDLIELGRNQFELSWRDFAIVEINQKLMRLAGEIAEAFALRAYDSVQLAAAKTLHDGSGQKILFACFDKRLQKASAVMGMQAVNPD